MENNSKRQKELESVDSDRNVRKEKRTQIRREPW